MLITDSLLQILSWSLDENIFYLCFSDQLRVGRRVMLLIILELQRIVRLVHRLNK